MLYKINLVVGKSWKVSSKYFSECLRFNFILSIHVLADIVFLKIKRFFDSVRGLRHGVILHKGYGWTEMDKKKLHKGITTSWGNGI